MTSVRCPQDKSAVSEPPISPRGHLVQVWFTRQWWPYSGDLSNSLSGFYARAIYGNILSGISGEVSGMLKGLALASSRAVFLITYFSIDIYAERPSATGGGGGMPEPESLVVWMLIVGFGLTVVSHKLETRNRVTVTAQLFS